MTMLRFEIREADREPLPMLDLEGEVVIGSGPHARVRLPHTDAQEDHVRVVEKRWNALGEVVVDGVERRAKESGAIGAGVVLGLGRFRVAIGPSPEGVGASSEQRTQSLARELVRAMLGGGEPPTLTIETIGPAPGVEASALRRGPKSISVDVGAVRSLQPPESSLVIGRGDDADWVVLDEDLSRVHVEIQRNWDGTWIRDLESKNGTKVTYDGQEHELGKARFELRDGCTISLGNLVLRFKDPAERHLRAGVTRSRPPAAIEPVESPPVRGKGNPMFWVMVAIAVLAAGAAVAVLVAL